MKKFVLIPDSFKGTLSSTEICEILESEINGFFPDSKVVSIPVADGGEGTVDCFLHALGGEKIRVKISDPYFNKIDGFYGLINGDTAVIEMAVASGLPLVENNKNPLLTTTYGVGELILDALNKGVKNIILGLGGSCTNDFGCGSASALGVKFYDKDNKEFIPVGGTLKSIERIDFSKKSKLLEGVKVIAMCDIDNPPFGDTGASRVFAPQKGADEKTVELLDEGVKHLCSVIKEQTGVDYSELKGGGAAGAFGAGARAFFNAELKSGINAVLDAVDFDNVIKDADYIFTGEGKIDSQSLRGKVVIGVSNRAKKQNVPVIAIVGGAEENIESAFDNGVSAIFTINRLPEDFSVSRYKSKDNLKFTVDNILRLIKTK